MSDMMGTDGHLLSSFPNILVSQSKVGLFLKIVIFQGISGYFLTIIKQYSAVCCQVSLCKCHYPGLTESCGHCSLCSVSRESGEWLSSGVEWPTLSRCQCLLPSADTHLVSVNTNNETSIIPSMFYFHDITAGECRLCPRPGYKGFWLNHSWSGCVSLDQSEAWCWAADQWEALHHHSASLWSRKLVTLHSIYELHPHMCPDSDNNQHGAHTEFDNRFDFHDKTAEPAQLLLPYKMNI